MHLSEIWHSKKNDCRLSRTQVSKKTSGLPIINPHITSKKRKLADRQGEKTVGTIQEKITVVTEM